MAHTFGTTVLARASSAVTTIARTATTVAGDTVLVVVLDVKSATNRTGGSLLFNGVVGVQANIPQKAVTAPEASIEIWYWLAPFIGAGSVVIPNNAGATIFSAAYTGRAGTDRGSMLDVTAGTNGTSASPTVQIDTTAPGEIVFAATAGGWQAFAPTARTGTALYETDDGATGGGAQYVLGGGTILGMSWTFATSDDWGAVAVAFKETLQPGPAPSALTLTGRVAALALTMGLAAGSLGLTGPAPNLQISSPVAPTIGIQVGTLQFKGPARPTTTSTIGATALALTGPAPTLTLVQGAITLTPAPGALVLTGAVPVAPPGQLVSIQVGSLQFQGPQRLGTVGADLGRGTLALTGWAPSGIVNPLGSTTITPGVGALTLTGLAPIAARNQIPIGIPVGLLRFQGPSNAQGPVTSAIGTGALTLAGLAPTRVVSGATATLPIPLGALVLSGAPPQVFAGQVIPVAVGTLTLAGQYVAQAFDWGQPAALVLTGYSPAVLSGFARLLPIGAATLTLSSPAPVALVQAPVPVGVGALTLNGLAPQLTISNPSTPTLGINAASLVLTGPVPTLLASESAYVPTGALVLTGWAPQLSMIDPSVLTRQVRVPGRQRVAVIRGREHTT